MGSVGNQLYADKVVTKTIKGSKQLGDVEDLDIVARRTTFDGDAYMLKKVLVGGFSKRIQSVDTSVGTPTTIDLIDSNGDFIPVVIIDNLGTTAQDLTLDVGDKVDDYINGMEIEFYNEGTADVNLSITGQYSDGSSYAPTIIGGGTFPYVIPDKSTRKFYVTPTFDRWVLSGKGSIAP